MRLFVIEDMTDRCFESGIALRLQAVTLELGFPEDVFELEIPLGYAQDSQIYYLPMPLLQQVAQQINSVPFELEDVTINGEEVELFLASPERVIAWAEFNQQLRQASNLPQASFDEAKRQPKSPMIWQLVGGTAGWVEDLGEGQGGLSYVYILLDQQSEAVLSMKLLPAPPKVQDLQELVYQAVVYPMQDTSGEHSRRPQHIHVDDINLMEILYQPMQLLDIVVKRTEIPQAREVFTKLLDQIGGSKTQAFLNHFDKESLKRFFEASERFFDLEPWERLKANRFVAFKLDDEPWRYCSVMGHMGEEFGLAMFKDWLEVCKFVHNQPTPFELMTGSGATRQIDAVGSVESLSMQEIGFLNAEDILYLQGLGFDDTEYPLPLRMNLEGPMSPFFDLRTYQYLLEGLNKVLGTRRASQISTIKKTFEMDNHRLELRYPAKGDETLVHHEKGYRLVVSAKPLNQGKTLPEVKKELVIETRGDTTLHKLSTTIRLVLGEFYVTGFGTGLEGRETIARHALANLGIEHEDKGTVLWTDRNQGYHGPHLRVAQLEGLSDLWLEQWMTYYPISLMPIDSSFPEGEIRITKQ
jgi:hypothetical protein